MLIRMGMAAAILLSLNLQAAPSCRALSDKLSRFPPAKISESSLEQFRAGRAWGLSLTAAIKPSRANFLFMNGNKVVLPVNKIQITMATNFIKGERAPRVSKEVMTVSLVSPEQGGMAFAMMEFPVDAFNRNSRSLRETPRRRTTSTIGVQNEFSYQNGILTYITRQEMVYARRNMLGLMRERYETEVTIVKLEVDETLTRFGRIEFTQRTEKSNGELIGTNTMENIGAYSADIGSTINPANRNEINPAEAGITAAISDYVAR